MRYIDISGGIRLTLSNEENDLVSKIRSESFIAKEKLDEREVVIANILVSKGALVRIMIRGEIYYKENKMRKDWKI